MIGIVGIILCRYRPYSMAVQQERFDSGVSGNLFIALNGTEHMCVTFMCACRWSQRQWTKLGILNRFKKISIGSKTGWRLTKAWRNCRHVCIVILNYDWPMHTLLSRSCAAREVTQWHGWALLSQWSRLSLDPQPQTNFKIRNQNMAGSFVGQSSWMCMFSNDHFC